MTANAPREVVSRGHVLPAVVPGFETVDRYWDPLQKVSTAKILPGEFYVTRHDEQIVTVLGSCVSACMRDARAGVGGMNHFMLPANADGTWGGMDLVSSATRYGNYAMEHMINDILKHGGRCTLYSFKVLLATNWNDLSYQ